MKYDLEIHVDVKNPVIPLNLKIDEKVVREFKYVAKLHRVSMTHVITKMLKEFVNEYKAKDEARSHF